MVTACETEENQRIKNNRKVKCQASEMPAYRVREPHKQEQKMRTKYNKTKKNTWYKIKRNTNDARSSERLLLILLIISILIDVSLFLPGTRHQVTYVCVLGIYLQVNINSGQVNRRRQACWTCGPCCANHTDPPGEGARRAPR